MKRLILALLAALLLAPALLGQQNVPSLPRVMRYSGVVTAADGTPRTGVVGVMFSLYAEQQGGTALWTELQNAQLDANGQYTVLLGSQHAEGVPADLFTTNEARWLGIQVEAEPEQPRVLLVSVPYALKAGDAETLGGRPFSDFVLSSPAGTSTVKTTSTAGTVQPSSVNTSTSGGTAGYVARWSDASTLANSQLTDDGNNVRLTTNGSKLYFSTPSGNPPYFSGNLDSQLDVLGATGGTRWLNNAGSAVNMVLLNNGNVGVGTGAPAVKLDVNGNTNVYGNLKLTASNGQLQFNTPTGNAPYFSGNLDSQLDVLGAVNGTRWLNNAGSLVNMVLLDNGNMGVGIGAPAAKLDVNGNVIVRSGGITLPDGSVLASTLTYSNQANFSASTSDQVVHATQNGAGAGSLTIATLPSAVRGDSSATTGFISGVLGSSASPSGFGVFGENLASSGNAVGTFGVSATSTTGTGVWGEAESTTGTTVGVYGKSASTNGSLAGGTGVLGYANSTTGDAVGVYGLSDSTTGTGVWGDVSASTGTTYGVYGSVASAAGTAGVFDNTNGGNLLLGRAGSGRTNVFRVDSTGKGFFNNGTQVGGADFAESVEVSGVSADYKPGDVLMIDATGYRRLALASEPYSTKVAGIYSTKPGVLATPHTMDDPRLAGEVPLAVVGIVPCKVSTENGPIEPGDLLVSSSTPGYAMKGTDRGRMLGAVVGKAMQSLKQGSGVIEVLVSLH